MTTWPRITVAAGQPLASKPSKAVQPGTVGLVLVCDDAGDLQVDDGEEVVAVVAHGPCALAGDLENSARAVGGEVDEALRVNRPSATWVKA